LSIPDGTSNSGAGRAKKGAVSGESEAKHGDDTYDIPEEGETMLNYHNGVTHSQRSAALWSRRRDVAIATLGWALIVSGLLWLAGHIAHTLLMLAIAALFAYALAPAVTVLRRFLPKWAAMVIVYFAVLTIVAAIFTLLVSTIITEVTGLATQVTHLLSPNQSGDNTPLYRTLTNLGISTDQITAARNWATQQLGAAAGTAAPIVTGLVNGLLDIVLVTVLSIYLLLDGPRMVRWLRSEIPLSQRERSEFLIETLQQVAGGYVRGELILCTLIGVLVGVGMQLLGVPFAILLGVMAFFFEFIPFLGPLLSAATCVIVAISVGWVTVGLVLLYFVGIHIIEGYVVGPRVLGHSLGLHPAISIVALLIGGEVFGLWGALFAAPIAGVLQVVLSTLWSEWREAHPQQFPEGPTDQTTTEIGATPEAAPSPTNGAGATQGV
jgi:predicted PurR-regulated permease PerM